MVTLKAYFLIMISPFLMSAILVLSWMLSQNILVLMLMTGTLLVHLFKMRTTLYSYLNHWVVSLFMGGLIYVTKQADTLYPLLQCAAISGMTILMLMTALPHRSSVGKLLQVLKGFPDVKTWVLKENTIIIMRYDETVLDIKTGGLRAQEMRWLTYHILAWDHRLRKQSVRVNVDENLGRCETIELSRGTSTFFGMP